MATILTHPVAACTLVALVPLPRKPARFWIAAALLSMLPDADVVGFEYGIRYGDLLGHRGLSHSLLFAAVCGWITAFAIGRGPLREAPKTRLALALTLATASHGLLDAFTDGGLGVAFFAPFDTARYFLPWRPILVSPIGLEDFLSEYGMSVLVSELAWVWLPCAPILAGAWLLHRSRASGPP
ncbi:MAG: metal-dependent hydrolase [Planctomycetes bacterium]|nr:metal-dependent hydrolase [Planctomycetota bacterium]